MKDGKTVKGGTLRPALREAAADYRWLLDRGYPDQPSIKLVGDRYQLTGIERAMLFRGVFSGLDSERRSGLLEDTRGLLEAGQGKSLIVDGHNVLFTVWNYLNGRPMVRGSDGFIRDIGGTHTRLPHDERFERLAHVLCECLMHSRLTEATILLDEPLPWSREHRATIEKHWNELRETSPEAGTYGRLTVKTEPHVDAAVAAVSDAVIATSDTGIINRCAAPVVDLGGHIVTQVFGADPADMLGKRGGS